MTTEWKERERSINKLLMDELRAEMDKRNVTPTQVAERVGAQYSNVTRWLSGEHVMTTPRLMEFCDAVGTDAPTLIANARARGISAPDPSLASARRGDPLPVDDMKICPATKQPEFIGRWTFTDTAGRALTLEVERNPGVWNDMVTLEGEAAPEWFPVHPIGDARHLAYSQSDLRQAVRDGAITAAKVSATA